MPVGSSTTVKIPTKAAPQGANDLHLVFDQDVDVKGVDGVSPDDPKASYSTENDGKGTVTVSDMNFSNTAHPDDVDIRVKGTTKATKPKVDLAHSFWTIDGKQVGQALGGEALQVPAR